MLVVSALPTLTPAECRAWSNENEPIPKSAATFIRNTINENEHFDPESVNLALDMIDRHCVMLLVPEILKK